MAEAESSRKSRKSKLRLVREPDAEVVAEQHGPLRRRIRYGDTKKGHVNRYCTNVISGLGDDTNRDGLLRNIKLEKKRKLLQRIMSKLMYFGVGKTHTQDACIKCKRRYVF